MTTELLCFAVVCVLGIVSYFQHRTYSERISELTKALIAKNTQEFIDLKLVDKKPQKQQSQPPQDVPLSDVTDEQFIEIVTGGKK